MPRLSVWFLRSALTYLVLGMSAGALLLAHRGVPFGGWVPSLRPLHIEFLLIGWTIQLAFGVAFWILPRFRSGAERGRELLAWTAYWLLNAGVLTTAIGGTAGALAEVQLAGRMAETFAATAFALHAWPRLKATGVRTHA
jgi:cbb3-type cytochrome oxidase subunit 1